MKQIAHIESPFPTKFGIPRQAGIVASNARIIFEPEYRVAEAVRELENFEYIWLIWVFNQAERETWSPTVRPPRLGGNKRVGVFATRSPFRPNPIGLSSVKLDHIEYSKTGGPILHVIGADLLDNTPILDIKPYLPYTDSHPDARSGFAPTPENHLLEVSCPDLLLQRIPETEVKDILDILAHDPRPQYHQDPERIYHLIYNQTEISFQVSGNALIVTSVTRVSHSGGAR